MTDKASDHTYIRVDGLDADKIGTDEAIQEGRFDRPAMVHFEFGQGFTIRAWMQRAGQAGELVIQPLGNKLTVEHGPHGRLTIRKE